MIGVQLDAYYEELSTLSILEELRLRWIHRSSFPESLGNLSRLRLLDLS